MDVGVWNNADETFVNHAFERDEERLEFSGISERLPTAARSIDPMHHAIDHRRAFAILFAEIIPDIDSRRIARRMRRKIATIA